MKDLFVCYAGLKRSAWAAEIARTLAAQKSLPDYQARNLSIGEACMSVRSGVKYNRIFVMEDRFKDRITRDGYPSDQVFILNVTGELQRPETSVRAELERKLTPYFSNLPVQ